MFDMCLSVCIAHKYRMPSISKASDLLEIESQAVMNHPPWVLGPEHQFPAGAV